MAIAYYIPDQAKLLAGRRSTREEANSNRNDSSASPPTNSQQSTRSPEDTTPNNPAVNRGYGTTINLTVPTYATQQETAGCWDFLTQVFCHALRFYHESSQLQPTVIQISVNFQSQTTAAQNVDTTTDATPETMENSNSATASSATANTTASTTTNNAFNPSATRRSPQTAEKPPKRKTSGKRKN